MASILPASSSPPSAMGFISLCIRTVETAGANLVFALSMILDSAERMVFGPDEKRDVPISKAMQASIALPLFYKPVRIGNEDYIDGAMAKTASIDVAIAKGADLIICYNPFRPFNRERHTEINQRKAARVSIADDGIYSITPKIVN